MIAPRSADQPRVWTVADLLGWTEIHFRKLGFATPRLDAEILLATALACTRLELYTGYRRVVEPPERERFRSFVERRGRGEPVAYITGVREFHSLRFEVSRAVLIPRPETEHLVDAAVEHLKKAGGSRLEAGGEGATETEAGAGSGSGSGSGSGTEAGTEPLELRVLDLGTGSGNIAISVAVEVPGARVWAVDRSPEALEVARRNAAAHAVADRIEALEGDLFGPLAALDPRPRFHAVLSNPPYIPPRERPQLMPDVRDFEPAVALFDTREGPDGDGMGFLRAIAREARRYLEPGGLLAVEVGTGQADRVLELFRAAGLVEVRSVWDLGGIARVVLGKEPAAQ